MIARLEPKSGAHNTIYGLDGRFSGQVFGRGYFPHEAEGLALYACPDGGGYWVGVDLDDSGANRGEVETILREYSGHTSRTATTTTASPSTTGATRY